MRISKENAQRIARALTKRTYDKWKKAEAAVPQYVAALYESKLPPDVKKFVKAHPEYISTTSTIYLDGVGLGHNASEGAGRQMPRNSGAGSSCRMKLTTEEAEKLVELRREKQDAEKAWEDLYMEQQTPSWPWAHTKRSPSNSPRRPTYCRIPQPKRWPLSRTWTN